MSFTFESMHSTPKPTPITVVFEGQDLRLVYDRAAFTMDMTENFRNMPIRTRLRSVLLSWDLLKDGVPWQPLPKDDPSWEEIIGSEGESRVATPAERDSAYAAAWDDILGQLPRDFVFAVDAGVLDDFLGLIWRGRISANGSAPAPVTPTGGSTGGMTT